MTDSDDIQKVPQGVLCGIENLAEGRTASKEEIAEVLRFND